MSHDGGSSCKSYIKHPTEKERLDNLAFTTFPEDYLPYTSSYHRKAPYLVWDDGFRPHRKRRLKRWRESPACRCCTTAALVTAISVIVVGILSIVAVSIYLGVVTNLFRSPILSLSGKISVIEGDEFSDNLLNTSSYQFLAKAETYQAMLENVYLSSSLESAFVGAKVYAFRRGDLIVFFRIYLDRRKLLQSDKEILSIAKNIITDEATANKPMFNNLNIDPFSVEFREYDDEELLSASDFDFQKQASVDKSQEGNENSLLFSHPHGKVTTDQSSTTVPLSTALNLISTKGLQADKGLKSSVTSAHTSTEVAEQSDQFEPTLKPLGVNRGIPSVETVDIDEKTLQSQWQSLGPPKRTVAVDSVVLQSPKRDSHSPGRGSVRLLDEAPTGLHITPIFNIPPTVATILDTKQQPNVASSIMSSVSLVILPSSKNRTVTLNSKSGVNKNTIATVMNAEEVQVNNSENANKNSNAGHVETDKMHSNFRRDHASFRFIDHPTTYKTMEQDVSGSKDVSSEVNKQNHSSFLPVTTSHSAILIPEKIDDGDRTQLHINLGLEPILDNNNQSSDQKKYSGDYTATALNATSSTTLITKPTAIIPSNAPQGHIDSVGGILIQIKPYNNPLTPNEGLSMVSIPSSENVESTHHGNSTKPVIDVYEDGSNNFKLNNISLNGEKLDVPLDNFAVTGSLLKNFKIDKENNSGESPGNVGEDTMSTKGSDSSNISLTSTIHYSVDSEESQTSHPPKEVKSFTEFTSPVNNDGFLTTLPYDSFHTALNVAALESVAEGVSLDEYDHEVHVNYTTDSHTGTKEPIFEANITTSVELQYEDNASNISDSLGISPGHNTSFGEGLGGLPKIVPPFSDTQFNPNDINSDSEVSNENSFLDEDKFFPVTPLSALDVVALTLKPTVETPGEDFINLSDDENVVIHHITTPQVSLENDTSVASLGKHPTYLFNRCLEDEIPCNSGECVPSSYRCNMRRDCRDNSDEEDCLCAERLKVIGQSQKICDGVQDCQDLSDEENCPWCSSGQFICPQSRVCINMTQVCDGSNDCPFGTDEKYCVKLAEDEITANSAEYKTKGYLMVRKQGQWGKLCLENLSNLAHTDTLKWKIEELGRAVCNALTYKEFKEAKQVDDESRQSSAYYEISSEIANQQHRRSNAMFRPSECRSKDVVHVTCKSLECGMRPMAFSLRQRIVGGQSTTSGSWPWQVALYKEGDFQCGAVLVSDSWLISAGHCFYSTQTSHWTARLGLLRRGTELPSPSEQVRGITHIFLHPEYVDKGFINDIALLRLESPVPFSDYLRPLCLPNEAEDVSLWNGQQCSVIGWGKLFEVGHTFPDSLQEVRLPVISTEECRKKILFLSMYHITDNMFCAGYERGGRDACLGDSGGPLMCQRPDGRWVLLGVTSNGDGCGRPGRPGVYTKVTKYLSWLKQTMDADLPPFNPTICSGHRCPLGRCVPEQKVCDGRWDCSDGSDEISCLVR